ncbi:RNA polymerase sigma factor [Dictyobacter formicarum]|uniref:RNA polymerase sigma24 factor n=1 Tax=Dictyobacter formicarum TaxID=2778368 RepID=A0ABQ3VRC9_9CHLR|nr:sigma-70 family RNA polymerase sigma factor [Dictyobacter formicarum]GHO88380.1 RNA polymerase sigma24 factor [Dictyobacter formicarum]
MKVETSSLPAPPSCNDDSRVINMLRSGDEAVFMSLVSFYTNTMVNRAMNYVTARTVAEEVVQETWLAVFEGINCFKGHSSLKTWIFRILTNIAKTRARRERRSIPFSQLVDYGRDSVGPVVDADCGLETEQLAPHQWASFSTNWEGIPETCLLSRERCTCIEDAIKALVPSQRVIIILRDIEGCTPEETCHKLGISEGNQRVLLHRARARVRQMLEHYFAEQ